MCLLEFYKSEDECLECNCDGKGSENKRCDATGKCDCKPGYTGKKCTKCSDGYFMNHRCEGK